MMTGEELLKGCRSQKRHAQKALYQIYAPVLLGICRRYIRQLEDAEDVLLESFYKIFSHIHEFEGKGSFEGWMKRIAINESLMFLRRKHNFHLSLEENHIQYADEGPGIEEQLFEEQLLDLLDELPTGYRTIFNLYVLDGLKHREIAEQLGISINTSKSQLIQAKKKLATLLKKNEFARTGTA